MHEEISAAETGQVVQTLMQGERPAQSVGGLGKPEAYPTTYWWRDPSAICHLRPRFRRPASLVTPRKTRKTSPVDGVRQGWESGAAMNKSEK